MSSHTHECLDVYKDAVDNTCDAVDAGIKVCFHLTSILCPRKTETEQWTHGLKLQNISCRDQLSFVFQDKYCNIYLCQFKEVVLSLELVSLVGLFVSRFMLKLLTGFHETWWKGKCGSQKKPLEPEET